MSALDNVLVGMHARLKRTALGTRPAHAARQPRGAAARERGLELLDFVGLAGKRRDGPATCLRRPAPPGDRPGAGDRARLLLLDEPTAGMNPQETARADRLIRRLRAELGLTVLLIEHDMRVVMGISIG